MKAMAAVCAIAFSLGLALVLFKAPTGALMFTLFACFIVILIAYYRTAWRQDHSGSAVPPLITGPLGLRGLFSLQANRTELNVILSCALVFAGAFIGILVLISLE